MSSEGATLQEISFALGIATNGSIHKRLIRLRAPPVKRAARKPWDESEVRILRAAVADQKRVPEILQLLPGRTINAIKRMCAVLRIPNLNKYFAGERWWTLAEDAELLRLRAAGRTYADISTVMGRSTFSCSSRAGKLRRGLLN